MTLWSAAVTEGLGGGGVECSDHDAAHYYCAAVIDAIVSPTSHMM